METTLNTICGLLIGLVAFIGPPTYVAWRAYNNRRYLRKKSGKHAESSLQAASSCAEACTPNQIHPEILKRYSRYKVWATVVIVSFVVTAILSMASLITNNQILFAFAGSGMLLAYGITLIAFFLTGLTRSERIYKDLKQWGKLFHGDLSARTSSIISAGNKIRKLTDDPSNLDILIEALQDSDSDVRFSAADVLGEKHNSRAIEALKQALQDDDSGVRDSALESLKKLGVEV
jgi:hypothetical protein